MSGIHEWNFPEFRHCTSELREAGYEVISPVEMDEEQYPTLDVQDMDGTENLADLVGFDRRATLANDLAVICTEASGVATLPGWTKSGGAMAEVAAANAVNIPVLTVKQWLDAAF